MARPPLSNRLRGGRAAFFLMEVLWSRLLFLVVGLVVAALLVRLLLRWVDARWPDSDRQIVEPPAARSPSYSAKSGFLTPAERLFFLQLRSAAPASWFVFAQVRIADLVIPRSRAYADFNKIAQKHVDFVLVDADFRVLAAVELDDFSHSRSDRIERDIFVNSAFASASIPLLRFGCGWTPEALRERISAFVDKKDFDFAKGV